MHDADSFGSVMRGPNILLAAAAATLCASVALAQRQAPPAQPEFQWPQRMRNPQVLPAETGPDQLRDTMRTFATSLGVRCTHCHAGQEGQPLTTIDFASDANPRKNTARAMMRMVWWINRNEVPLLPGITPGTQVTCYTCHRGAAKPVSVAPPPPAPQPERRRRSRRS